MRPSRTSWRWAAFQSLVVCERLLELFERVDELALVLGVLAERGERPARQGLEIAGVVAVGAEVEAQLAPDHELVQEGLAVLVEPPPAARAAARLAVERLLRPARALGELGEDLVRREVPEVEVRGQAARDVGVGVVVLVRVARELAVEKGGELARGRR
ncbi:MAG: hypothetical protein QM765_04695 [Myxococcales bacterium]